MIIFRYGDSTQFEKMKADQAKSGLSAILYPENGKSQREQVEIAKKLIGKTINFDVISSSEVILDMICLASRKGNVAPENVKILYYKEPDKITEISLDLDGRLSWQPDGFFDSVEQITYELYMPVNPIELKLEEIRDCEEEIQDTRKTIDLSNEKINNLKNRISELKIEISKLENNQN